MISGKLTMIAGVVAAMALVAGPSAIAAGGEAPPLEASVQPRMLSAAELEAFRTGRTNELPEYCWVEYNHFNGQCNAVICAPPGGFWSIHECDEFGL